MYKRHGLSHALATLVSITASGFFAKILYFQYPILKDNAIYLCRSIKNQINIPISADYLAIIILASIFAFVWGIMFFYLNNRRYSME